MKAVTAFLLFAIVLRGHADTFQVELSPYTLTNTPTAARVTDTSNTNFAGMIWVTTAGAISGTTSYNMSQGVVVFSFASANQGQVTLSISTNAGGTVLASGVITVLSPGPLPFVLSCQRNTGMICHYYDRIYYDPYFANSAAYFLLQSHPEQAPFIRNYLAWYFTHLETNDVNGISGTMYNYAVSNFTETPALANGQPGYDSSDATAGLFLATAWEYLNLTKDSSFITQNLQALRSVAGAALATQDSDGLTWATPSFHTKYLEDQCETWTGLNDFAQLLQSLGQSDWTNYQQSANAQRAGIAGMWNSNLNNGYFTAKNSNGSFVNDTWADLVANGQPELWPILFNIDLPASPRAHLIWQQFAAAFPDWDSRTFTSVDGGPWPGSSYALVSAKMQGRPSSIYISNLVAVFESDAYRWPMTPDAAAQLLAIPPKINSLTVSNSIATLNYTGVPQVQYYIQASADLSGWNLLQSNFPTSNGIGLVTDAGLPPKTRYYRIATGP